MSFIQFIADQYKHLPLAVSQETCSGHTYIVTGANTGLGFEAARHLAACNAQKVVIAVRNTAAGEKARRDIEASTAARGNVEVWQLDLSSYASVRAFAERATRELDRVDALIENAGIATDVFKLTEGHESAVMTNVLATFLLATLLLPKLGETAKKYDVQPHVVIVSSEVALYGSNKKEMNRIAADPLRALDDEKNSNMSARYPLSKLLQVFAARELSDLAPVRKTGVIVNFVNPGLCKTTLSSKASFITRTMIGLMNLLVGRTPEAGSRNLLHAATAGESSHGCYLSSCEIENSRLPSWITDAKGREWQKSVWMDIARELERVQPGCTSVLRS